jgi:hypothetical protein
MPNQKIVASLKVSSNGTLLRRGDHLPILPNWPTASREGLVSAVLCPRVWWADVLVSSVHTRPRTLRKDVALLFYSRADEKSFRREARRVRAGDQCHKQLTEEDTFASLSNDDNEESTYHKAFRSSTREHKNYGISKVVVVSGNAKKTYRCTVETILDVGRLFDDDSFWNSQIAWS